MIETAVYVSFYKTTKYEGRCFRLCLEGGLQKFLKVQSLCSPLYNIFKTPDEACTVFIDLINADDY